MAESDPEGDAGTTGNPVLWSDAIRRNSPLGARRQVNVTGAKSCPGCEMHPKPHLHVGCSICGEERPLLTRGRGQKTTHHHVHKVHHDAYAIMGWRSYRGKRG